MRLRATALSATGWNRNQGIPPPALDLDFRYGAFDSRITYTGGLATMLDSSENVVYGPHNYLRTSETGSAWALVNSGTGVAPVFTPNHGLAPDGTMTAHRVQLDSGAAGQSTINFPNTGATFAPTFSVWIRSLSGPVDVTIFAVGVSTISVTSTWQRFSRANISASITEGRISKRDVWGTAGAADLLIWHPQMEVTDVNSPNAYFPNNNAVNPAFGPRLTYNASTGLKEFLVEEARTNYCLWSDNLTNAAWTKSNLTTSFTATGADGLSNSATILTATAANATALQAITRASAARITGVRIKRRTGSGVVQLTQDNGTTWTAVTVTAGWTRVEIPSATLANPTVGIRIVTSGDAVDVEYFQHEEGELLTSDIPTTTEAVTRIVDSATMTGANFSDWFAGATEVTMFADATSNGIRRETIFTLDDSTTGFAASAMLQATRSPTAQNGGLTVHVGGGVVADWNFVTSLVGRKKIAARLKENDMFFYTNGAPMHPSAVVDTSCAFPPGLNKLTISGRSASGNVALNGGISRIQVYRQALNDAQLQALTTL